MLHQQWNECSQIECMPSIMEFHSDCCEESNDRKTSKVNTWITPQAKQRKKLGSILNFEKCERTYDDLHPQVLINAEKSKGFHQNQQVERKSQNSEELVMYMSCLPSYLERGETPQEKPFNIGVLDWRLLQKWQHNNNDFVGINSEHSPSTSNSTFISSKGSSSYFSSDNIWSHHQQKTKYPSPQTEGCSSGLKGNSIISGLKGNGVVSGLKGNGNREASKAKEQVPSSAVTDRDLPERGKTSVPESRNDPGSRYFAVRHQSDSSKGGNNRSLQENRYTSYGGCSEKACQTKSRSDHNRFYSIASERGKTKDSLVEKSIAKEIRNLNCPSGNEQTIRFTESASISPFRRRNLEKKNSGSKPRNLAENEISQMKVGISESTKVRNPSPTRRFSFGMGRIGKSSNSNSSATVNQVSENVPHPKVTCSSACSNYSTAEKSNAASRGRSSPLRRLLDAILKPKGVDSHDIGRSSERNPSKTDRTLKSSSRQIEPPALRSVKGTSDLNGSRIREISGPHHSQKNGASSMQALMQVAVKNGLPLFTFTVDSCSDILAATVKELSSNKTMRRWIYTYFSFSEMKKKNNGHWMNQGSKDRNHGYIPNIVAQMKVSDILYTDSSGERHVSNTSRREFVLSSVGITDVDQTSDSFPGDELAAIVVKFPERMSMQRCAFDIPQVRYCSNSGDDEGNESASDDLFSTTVILPGGHHGVPSKGEPSPLIERWKSGGLCDCGGWDLGCQLRILANKNRSNQRFKSAKSPLTAFELFSQEDVEEERPVFGLSPFEDGIFSVEFNSSLKLVQAFSIGIAVLHSRTSAVLSSDMSGGKMFDEIMASGNSAWKSFNQARFEVSAKYAANPPLSPVGRV